MLHKASDFIANILENKRRLPFWKYKFDEKSYINDFSSKSIKKTIFIVSFLLLFSDFITKNVLNNVIDFFYHNLNDNNLINLVFYYIISPYIIIICVIRAGNGYIPTLNSLINCVLFTIAYGVLIRNNVETTFLPLNHALKFADIVFAGFLFLISKWSLYFTRDDNENKNYQFLTEKKNELDLFGYKGLSIELERFIHFTETDNSFAIGILGNWGDGKSYLSNNLLSELSKFPDDYIILDFNPWLYDKDQLIGGFFNEFLNVTSSIDRSLKNDFASYASKITEQSDNEKIQLTNFLLKLLSDSRTINEVKCSISEKIKFSRKKVVVFIDDTDRLDAEEIQSVLKIIRNTANFANTFFIAGIDFNYIDSKIDDIKYLKKIFNVLITLPKVSTSTLKNEILNRFEKHFPNDDDITDALDDLLQHEWFISFIKNLRQLNRLINSFKIAYNNIQKNVDITDLLILETLKNSATAVYFDIFNGNILKYDPNEYQTTEQERDNWEIKLDPEKKYSETTENLQNALEYLIRRGGKKHFRSFSAGYQLMYFNYATIGIDIVKFYNTLNEGNQIIINQFNEWLAKGNVYFEELLQLLSLELAKNPIGNYKKFVPILIEIENIDFSTRVFRDVYLQILNTDLEKNEDKIFSDVFLNIFSEYVSKKPMVSLQWTSIIMIEILRAKEKLDDKSFIENIKGIVEEIYRISLKNLLNQDFKFEQKYEAFKKCVVDLENNIFQYDPNCQTIFKNYVINNNKIEDLIKASIRPYWNDVYKDHTREVLIIDFLSLVFVNKNELLNRIINLKSPRIDPLVKFLKKHVDKYYEFRELKQTSYSKYVNDEELHRELLEYFNNTENK